MKKTEIISLLNEKHQILFSWLDANGEQYWDFGLPGKWNSGQIVLHLIQSEHALNRGLKMPKFFLRYRFGRPNRVVRNYKEIVKKYQQKLLTIDKDLKSPFSQKMNITTGEHGAYIKMLKDEHKRMISNIEKRWNDKKLSAYLLPHPLLGRMHIAEILLWTAYHTEHHYLQLKNRSEQSSQV